MTEDRIAPANHWNGLADAWRHWAPPLRPGPQDIRAMEALLHRWGRPAPDRSFRALLWGVTPEIAEMDWPAGTELLAVDQAQDMIDRVWPGDWPGRRRAVCADWLDYPPPAGALQAIVGDGVFVLIDYPNAYAALVQRARALLASDGILLLRAFVRPPHSETPQQVFDDLRGGHIGNFHIFKFRLAMALQTQVQDGVCMNAVYETWAHAGIGIDALAAATDWSRESIATILHYRGKEVRLTFPTLAELRALLAERFELLDCQIPGYEMGERCPTLCLRARS